MTACLVGAVRIDATLDVWRDQQKAAQFVARFYDTATESFYSGAGTTGLEAIAWCMHDYLERAVLDRPHSMARRADVRPGDFERPDDPGPGGPRRHGAERDAPTGGDRPHETPPSTSISTPKASALPLFRGLVEAPARRPLCSIEQQIPLRLGRLA